MLLLVTALPLEAKPLIRAFTLKQDLTSHPFPLYRGKDCCLVISGTGKIRSAMATTWLFSQCSTAHEADCWINFGFCGTSCQQVATGALVRAGKIVDRDTDRHYYPDLGPDFTEETITLSCCPRHVIRTPDQPDPPVWCDMESAGFMEAAGRFSAAHRIHVLKIVSDHLEPQLSERRFLMDLIEQKLALLSNGMTGLAQPWVDQADPTFPDGLQQTISQLSRQNHFTVSMQQQLNKAVRRAVAFGCNPDPLLQQVMQRKAVAKQEGKRLLAGLLQELYDQTTFSGHLC